MRIRQSSFATGEVAPTLWGRTDFAKYVSAAKLIKNWFVTQHGALMNRAGFVDVAGTKALTGATRLVPFRFSDGGNYVLEFGAGYVRFFANGAQIMSGGLPYEVATPYAAAHIWRLKFDQSGDIITITNRNYEPYELRHYGETNWTISTVGESAKKTFSIWRSDVTYAAGDIVLFAYGAIWDTWHFAISLQDNNLNHSFSGTPTAWWDTADTLLMPPPDITFVNPNATPPVGGVIGDYTVSDDTTDVTRPPKEWQYVVTSVDVDGAESMPSLVLEPRSNTDGAKNKKCQCYTDRVVGLTWGAMKGAAEYRVYKGRSGVFGFIGSAMQDPTSPGGGGYFKDDGIPPDFGTTPPTVGYPFKIDTWRPFQQYLSGQTVVLGGNVYRCIVSGVSGSTGPTGTGIDITDGATSFWVTGHAYVTGNRVLSNGNTYECISDHTSSGTLGPYGTGFYAFVANDSLKDGGTTRWKLVGQGGAAHWKFEKAEAAYDPPYPDCSTYYNQRHMFAVRSVIYGSAVGDFYNFVPGEPITEDSAIGFILSSARWEEIRSLLGTRTLLALTNMTEWSLTGAGGAPLTATSVQALPQSRRGSSWVDPLLIGPAAIDVQERGNVVREILFDLYTDAYKSTEISLLARHLLDGHEIVDWTFAENPYSVIWAVRDDGILLGCTYVREQEMVAWFQADTQGTFESVASIIEGNEDAVYAIVTRNGVRRVERMASRVIDRTNPSTWRFLDSSKQFTGSALKTVSGLTWLEGKSVMILADGCVQGPYTVTGGTIDFSSDVPDGASVVDVGLAYDCDGELLPAEAPGQPIRLNKKNVYRIGFEYADGRGLSVGADFDSLIPWPQRAVKDAFGMIPLETGFDHVRINSTFAHEGPCVFRHSDPLPFTLLAIEREVNVGGG